MSAERWVFKCAAGHRCEAAEAIVAERDAEIDRLRAELTVANNRLGNAVGALIDAGTYCTGVDDVTAGIDRLRAENAKLAEHPVAPRASQRLPGSRGEPVMTGAFDPQYDQQHPRVFTCGYSLSHRGRHQCDCVCVRLVGHDGAHQCAAEFVPLRP